MHEALRGHLPPEFLGRLTATYVFQPLGKAAMRQIAEKFVRRVEERLSGRAVRLAVSDEAYELILRSAGPSWRLGARPLEHAVDRLLVASIGQALLNRPAMTQPQTLNVLVQNNALTLVWDLATTDAP